MKQIELTDSAGDSGAAGLMALVVAVLEILLETMEREALRRMESGRLTAEEIERLGQHLQEIESEIASIKEREGIAGDVDRLRDDLNDLVLEAVEQTRATEGLPRE